MGQDPCAVIDPFRMRQVFRNLLENALAACPDPIEITIRCSAEELDGVPTLRLTERQRAGVYLEQRKRAFKAFYTTKTKGTGLGLAIAGESSRPTVAGSKPG